MAMEHYPPPYSYPLVYVRDIYDLKKLQLFLSARSIADGVPLDIVFEIDLKEKKLKTYCKQKIISYKLKMADA